MPLSVTAVTLPSVTLPIALSPLLTDVCGVLRKASPQISEKHSQARAVFVACLCPGVWRAHVLIRRAPFCVALVWNIRGAGLLTASGYGPGFPTVWFHAMRLQNRCDRASMVFWYHCLYETVGGGRYNPDTSLCNSVTVCQGMFE